MKQAGATRGNALRLLRQAGLKPPDMLTIAITGACNLQCRHCWVDGGTAASTSHVPEALLRRIIQEYSAMGGKGLRLTGGEPLCHPECLNLLRFARSLSLTRLSLQTNANLIQQEQADALYALDFPGLNIQVSLDGVSAATHDLIRGQGSYAGALAGLKSLVRAGLAPRLSIFFTEMHHNLEELPELLELADSLGIPSVTSGALVRCGRAADDGLVAPATLPQYLRLLDRFESDQRFQNLYRKLGKVAAIEWRTAETLAAQECTFIENPYLSADGILYPCLLCHADSYAVKNVFTEALGAAVAEGIPLWTSLLNISRNRASNIAQCQTCTNQRLCGAGCPGRTWGSCGDFMAPEDRCALRRAIYQERKGSHRAP